MKDMINVATVKFPHDKGLILIRGGLISRSQLTNICDGKITIDDVTLPIARRINRFTDMMVGVGETFFDVHNNDEAALVKAYMCESYDTQPQHHIGMDSKITIYDDISIEHTFDEEVEPEHEDAIEEDVIEAETEIASDEEVAEVEEAPSGVTIKEESDDSAKTEPIEIPVRQINHIAQPSNKYGKKHRH